MTGGVEHHLVLCGVRATVAAPDDVVEVPSCLIGERLVADRTEAVLCFPQRHELSLALKFVRHCRYQSLLEVDFPGRVVRVGLRTQLDDHFIGLVLQQLPFQWLSAQEQKRVIDDKLATSREPGNPELRVLLDGLERRLAHYQHDRAAAEKLMSIGEAPRDKSLDVAELAAYTTVASVILNLDEVITKQ